MRRKRTRSFTLLLFTILAFVIVPAFLPSPDAGGIIVPGFLSGILVAAIFALRRKQGEFLTVCAIAIPALALRWIAEFRQDRLILIFAAVSWILLLGITVFFILRHILTASEITYDTISGAICGYLLFGLMNAVSCGLIELTYPGSYAQSGRLLLPDIGHLQVNREIIRYTYFSLVTLAGVGYGDITPIRPPAQAIAALEAISGQFYIAVLIARLVSIHASRSSAVAAAVEATESTEPRS